MGFWRSFVRRHTKPIDPDHARRMKNRYSALYFLAAWNLFGYAVYLWSKEAVPPKDESESSSIVSKAILLKFPFFFFISIDRFREISCNLWLFSFAAHYYSKLLGLGQGTVYHFRGMELVEKFENPAPKERKIGQNSKNDEKTLPNEDLELLVEETGSL